MKGRRIKEKGKIRFSDWFRKFDSGDKVAIIKNPVASAGFPKRVIGLTGKVLDSRGAYKLIEVKEGNKTKTFIIHPIHLKKLK